MKKIVLSILLLLTLASCKNGEVKTVKDDKVETLREYKEERVNRNLSNLERFEEVILKPLPESVRPFVKHVLKNEYMCPCYIQF